MDGIVLNGGQFRPAKAVHFHRRIVVSLDRRGLDIQNGFSN